jgi:hypothetical protein
VAGGDGVTRAGLTVDEGDLRCFSGHSDDMSGGGEAWRVSSSDYEGVS